jgi:hypothetical protein
MITVLLINTRTLSIVIDSQSHYQIGCPNSCLRSIQSKVVLLVRTQFFFGWVDQDRGRGRTELNVLENSWFRNNHASLLQFAMQMTSKLLETRDVMPVKKGWTRRDSSLETLLTNRETLRNVSYSRTNHREDSWKRTIWIPILMLMKISVL